MKLAAMAISVASLAATAMAVDCVKSVAIPGEAESLLPAGRQFRLVWNDEFDGDRLDESKWSFRTNFWGRRAPWFAAPGDGAVEVKDGKVHLKIVRKPGGQFVSPQLQTGELMWDIVWDDNRTGFFPLPKREKPKFVHKYGYYECRFRLQRKRGWWSAFWMQTEQQGCTLDPAISGVEHDIMESFNPGEIIAHCFHANGYGRDWLGFKTPRTESAFDTNAVVKVGTCDFHTIGMLWEPDGYTVFIDGKQHGPKVGMGEGEAVSHVPEFILLTTECKPYRENRMTAQPDVNLRKELDDAVDSGDDFVVDFVRVYDLVKDRLEIFVAPCGNDSNPGTREKPMATPEGARDALRKAKYANGGRVPPGGAVVEFADGTYLVERPLVLEKQDSGVEGAPVVWRAAHRGKAVFSGAFVPSGWNIVEAPDVIALLPERVRGKVMTVELPAGMETPGFCGGGQGVAKTLQEIPLSLFQGETRLEPARWPESGFAHTGINIGEVKRDHDYSCCTSGVFKFSSPRLVRWEKEPELWAYGLWRYEWADAKTRIVSVDTEAQTLAVDMSPVSVIKEDAQFYVFNALSEISRPGEWVIDRANRRLYLLPVGKEPVLVACASGLVTVHGASDVTFDGFVFEHSRTAAISVTNACRVTVLSSTIRHTSSWGVIAHGRDCRVEGCDMYDLGEGGVLLAGGDFMTLTPGGNVADNNHIHHYGCIIPNYRPGVRIEGVGNRCTHNLVHHSMHQGISFRDWTKRGTVIERNIIHSNGSQPHVNKQTHAIYLDDYSSGIVIRGNIINRAFHGVSIGGGQDCEVYGNVLMNCRISINLGSRGVDSFARNIAGMGRNSALFVKLEKLRALYDAQSWKSRYPNMMRVFDFPDAQHAHDAHFNSISNNVLVTSGGVAKSNWQFISSTCVITNNLETDEDPGFEDYSHFRWNLKPGPVRDFAGPLCIEEMGLYESPRRASPAIKFAADVTRPFPLHREYDKATVRIDLPLLGDLPEEVAEVASGCQRCAVPQWGLGKRIVARFGEAVTNRW